MPITGPASVAGCLEEFIDHWNDVNAVLPPTAVLVIPKAVAGTAADFLVSDLEYFLLGWDSQIARVTAELNDIETHRASAELKKAALLVRLNQFNTAVRGQLAGTKWPAGLADVPGMKDGPETWRSVCDDVEDLWEDINTAAAMGPATPLELLGEYAVADFTEDAAALREAFRFKRRAERRATTQRDDRDKCKRCGQD